MNDFSSLLREQPEAAIATRLDYLEEKAKAARLDIESAKLSSLTLTAVGFALSANPLVAVIGGIGALGYVGSLVTDYMTTGRFCPVPALRKGVGELLSGFSSANNDYDPDPDVAEVEALASCLPPREAKEFWLLSRSSERLLSHILPMAPEQRLNAYGLAVRNPRILPTVNPALPAVTPYQALPPAPPTPEQPKAHIGPTTRLGAINVPAQNVSPQPSAQAPVAAPITALETILASPYTSRAIFGAQRCGKSYLAAIASQQLTAKGTTVFHLNLASFGDEDAQYWGHAKRSIQCDLSSLPEPTAVSRVKEAEAVVTEWWATRNAVLVVDEWAYTGSSTNTYRLHLGLLLQIIADKISAISSTGIKRQQALWTISPEFVAGSLVQDALAIKKLKPCLIAIPKGKSVDWNGSAITFNDELYAQLKNNYPIKPLVMSASLSGYDRVAFIDGAWLPVGLENHSLEQLPEPQQPEPEEEQEEDWTSTANEIIAEIRTKLIEKGTPLLASQIKQLVWTLKKSDTPQESIEQILEQMVERGLVEKDERRPPKYSVRPL